MFSIKNFMRRKSVIKTIRIVCIIFAFFIIIWGSYLLPSDLGHYQQVKTPPDDLNNTLAVDSGLYDNLVVDNAFWSVAEDSFLIVMGVGLIFWNMKIRTNKKGKGE